MANLILPPSWRLPEREVTPERSWMSRRELIHAMGLGAAGAALGCGAPASASPIPTSYAYALPEAAADGRWQGAHTAPLTPEIAAASYNNYYEFTTEKDQVWRESRRFQASPWSLEISGHCEAPRTFQLDELLAEMPLVERIYRFRCVEAWSMVVPWTGFPLKALIEAARPTSKARYVRLETLHDPAQFPGITLQPWYPWPYFEGLSMAEAMSELTLIAAGIYGHPLPNQHGAPLRLVTPWKYGYKSIKAIVKIELLRRRPRTFWSQLVPEEYDFYGNVRPDVPHPRWSQATERILPTGERIATRMYNGYAEQVAGLYP